MPEPLRWSFPKSFSTSKGTFLQGCAEIREQPSHVLLGSSLMERIWHLGSKLSAWLKQLCKDA